MVNSVIFNMVNKNFYHAFDPGVMGKVFGERKYSEVISVKDYLEGTTLTDKFIEGVGEGTLTRLKAEQREREKNPTGAALEETLKNAKNI